MRVAARTALLVEMNELSDPALRRRRGRHRVDRERLGRNDHPRRRHVRGAARVLRARERDEHEQRERTPHARIPTVLARPPHPGAHADAPRAPARW
jgi:hypothetical protein